MTAFLFDPGPRPSLPVVGSDQLYPVRRIYCVGRNYAAHVREMGRDPDREPPFFFLKPADAIVQNGGTIDYPMRTAMLHHEIELVAAIGTGGRDIPVDRALDHVFGYAVGIDLTRRDLQIEARDTGRPWDTGKAFDESAPCTAIVPAARIGHPTAGRIWLSVDGQSRQEGDIAQLIWSVPETVAALSTLFALAPGDLIMTGTPAGIGPVEPGQRMDGGIAVDGLPALTCTVRRG